MPAPKQKQNAAKRGRPAVAKDEPKVGTVETTHPKPGGDAKEIVKTIDNDDGNNVPIQERSKFPYLGNGDAREPEDETENMDAEVENGKQVKTTAQRKTAKGNVRLEVERLKKPECEAAAVKYRVDDEKEGETEEEEDGEEEEEDYESSSSDTLTSSSSSESLSEDEEMVSEAESPVKQDRGKAVNKRRVMTVPTNDGRHNKVNQESPHSDSKASSIDNIAINSEDENAEAPKKNDRKVDDDEAFDKHLSDEELTKEVEEPQAKRERGEVAKSVPKRGGRQGRVQKVQPESDSASEPDIAAANINDKDSTTSLDEETDEEVKKPPAKRGGRGNFVKKAPVKKRGNNRGKQQPKPTPDEITEDVEMKMADEKCTALSDEESDEEVKKPPVREGGRKNTANQAPVTRRGGRRGQVQPKPESDHDSEAENAGKEESESPKSPQDQELEEQKIAPAAKRGRGKVAKKAPAPKRGRDPKDEIKPESESDSASEPEAMQTDNVDVKDDDDKESDREEVVAKPPARRGRGKIEKEAPAPRKGGRNMKIEPEPKSKTEDDDIDEEVSSSEKPTETVSAKQPTTKRGRTAATAKKDVEAGEKTESAAAPTAARKRGQRAVSEEPAVVAPSTRPVRLRKPVTYHDFGAKDENEDQSEPPEKVAANKAKRAAPKKAATSQAKKATTGAGAKKK